MRIDAGIIRQGLDRFFRLQAENKPAPGCPTKPELDQVLPMVSPKNARFDPKAESTPDLPPPHPAARIPHFHRISQKEKGPKRKTRLLLRIFSPEIIIGEAPSSWQVTASGQHPGEPALTDLEPRHTLFGLTYTPAVSCPKDGEPLRVAFQHGLGLSVRVNGLAPLLRLTPSLIRLRPSTRRHSRCSSMSVPPFVAFRAVTHGPLPFRSSPSAPFISWSSRFPLP